MKIDKKMSLGEIIKMTELKKNLLYDNMIIEFWMLNCENITTYKNEFQQIYSVIIFNKIVPITIKKN